MISNEQYIKSALAIGCDVPAIKAVAEVEGRGEGFYKGRPIILFEPHVFYRELSRLKIEPPNSDICYPVWGTKPYPKTQAERWIQLERASKISRTAALKSCSWGMFQTMGFNWQLTDSKSLQDFVNRMYKSEDEHLSMFTTFIIITGLKDKLVKHDWPAFAKGYNGESYAKNLYDVKMKTAWLKHVNANIA